MSADDMPIQLPRELHGAPSITSVPWSLMSPHRAQALKNHRQSLEMLRSRGGVSACEAMAIIEDRAWHGMAPFVALSQLADLCAALGKTWSDK